MNYAVIFAGGVGKRLNNGVIPKQFLEINNKPIIIHTIEHFEKHNLIDVIVVACLKESISNLKALLEKHNIKKVKYIIAGGDTALQSQYNALSEIEKNFNITNEDIVLIHDGVRPLINEQTITDCIEGVKKYKSAITVSPAIETIITTKNETNVDKIISRSECYLGRAPQGFYIKDIISLHRRALEDGLRDKPNLFIDSASMMKYYGYSLHVFNGPAENIKVTTLIDYYTCKALMEKEK